MADVVLAECNGQAWLVSGEQHIDDLLANTLPPDVSIELVACESKSEVDALWVRHCGPPEPCTAPWLIHHAIANRVRRRSGDHSVFFGQWSARLDEDAHSMIRSAAAWAAQHAECAVLLVSFLPSQGAADFGTDSGAGLEDLANLRTGLLEAQLIRLGIARSRLVREMRDVATVPGMEEESQRIDIVVKVS